MRVKEIQGILRFYSEFSPVFLTGKIIDRSIPEMPIIHKFKYDIDKDGDFETFVSNLTLKYTKSYLTLINKKQAA